MRYRHFGGCARCSACGTIRAGGLPHCGVVNLVRSGRKYSYLP